MATVGPAHATTSVDQKATADEERAANASKTHEKAAAGKTQFFCIGNEDEESGDDVRSGKHSEEERGRQPAPSWADC